MITRDAGRATSSSSTIGFTAVCAPSILQSAGVSTIVPDFR